MKPIIPLTENNKHYHSNVSKASDKITSEQTISEHKYPTRSKVPIIANQLETKQVTTPTNVTIEPIIDAMDIPSFRYNHLIKGKTKIFGRMVFIERLVVSLKDIKTYKVKILYFR